MKAIDFACNLLKTLGESELSDANARLLFCLAAGLHYKEDMNTFLNNGCNNGNIGNSLRRLEQQKLIHLQNRETDYYVLTNDGKQLVAHLLRFLPHRHHSCERKDT